MTNLIDASSGTFGQFRTRFAAQFGEQDGLILFQAMPFTGLRLKRGPVYFIAPAERDRFIADFNRDGLVVMKRMLRDILLAMISFIVMTQIGSALAGNSTSTLEAALFYGHVATIAWVEHRRLRELWDAPAKALAHRAPAPGEFSQPRQLFRPMSELSKRELLAGSAIGPVCAYGAATWWFTAGEPGIQGLFQAGAAALCIGVVIFSARCIVETAVRIIKWAWG